MRGVFSITKIDSNLHFTCVKKPVRTSYTELLRSMARDDKDVQNAAVKRWLKAPKTNLNIEAELLQRWYPNATPCEATLSDFQVPRQMLRKNMHPAFQYDLEIAEGRIIRIHRIVKTPLTKKTMNPLVTYLVRCHSKRKKGIPAQGSKIRSKLGSHDWSTFDALQLRVITDMWFPHMYSIPTNMFKNIMNTWLTYEEHETPVLDFLNGRVDKMAMILSRAQFHNDQLTEAHTTTLDDCLATYRSASRSTAFETIHWLGPWFTTASNEDLSCPTCLEPMEVPVVTACQHAFCATCMDKIKDNCPLCRQDVLPKGAWNKCLTWFETSIHAREHAVRDALAQRDVQYVTEPVDDDSYVVVCAYEEDKLDWQYHFDNTNVVSVENSFRGDRFFLYQAHHFTLEMWETVLRKWDVSKPAIIHGRVDVAISFRGSLFRSLSACTEESKRAPMGPVTSWGAHPDDIEQFFVASNAAAETVHAILPSPKRLWVRLPGRPRGVRRIVNKNANNEYYLEDVERGIKLEDVKSVQADAVSIHRWPAGRVDVGAFVVTSNTKGCIPCAIRKAQALCVQTCHVICLDCPVPPMHCAHNACKPNWRTTLD